MPPLTPEQRLVLAAIIEDLDITAARAVLRQIVVVMSNEPSIRTKALYEILKDANLYNKYLRKKGQ